MEIDRDLVMDSGPRQLIHQATLYSNILQIDEKTKIKKLIGNVTIKHNETVFNCDSAYISEKGNIIEGFGHININENNSNLKSNFLLSSYKLSIRASIVVTLK